MAILSPTSVAVIGASEDPEKLGSLILRNIKAGGFLGQITAVNPKHTIILGTPCFPSIRELPTTPDLVVIATPAATVSSIVKECVIRRVETVIVISAGFGELGTEEGKEREKELERIVRGSPTTLIGPNCLGLVLPHCKLNASFAEASNALPGNVALISQSGAIAVAMLDAIKTPLLGTSAVISIGNKTLTSEVELVRILANDDTTKVIGLYLENIANGEVFLEETKKLQGKKPIVLLKAGTSARGASAVASHTGRLAGSDKAIDAACKEAGIFRAHTFQEFLELLRTFADQPSLLSPSIAIVTNAGGPGVLATDAVEGSGLHLATLTKESSENLRKNLPESASSKNPIDVLGDARADRFTLVLDTLTKDANVDGVVVLLTPQVMTPCEEIARSIVAAKKRASLMPIVCAFLGGPKILAAEQILACGGIPNFHSPERAIFALQALREFSLQQKHHAEEPHEISASPRAISAHTIIHEAHGLLEEELTDDLLSLYELPTPEQGLARTINDIPEIVASLGFPIIAKISSPDILHKTDVGGVILNIQSIKEAEEAWKTITNNVRKALPTAALRGVLLQQQLPIGSEFIIGALRDPSFGPMIMVGLGGIYAELFADVCFRIAPVELPQALDMLQSLKAWKLLTGFRGKRGDIVALAEIIVQTSHLIADCPHISAIDLNPVIVREKQVTVADAKVIVE